MTYTVYGIRIKGECETRYVGFTRLSPDERLKRHIRGQIFEAMCRPLLPWVKENKDAVEAFPIAKCATQTEARAVETLTIALCLAMGHRLLNAAQVPYRLRLAA